MLKIILSDSEKSSNLFWDDPVFGWQIWIIAALDGG